MYIAVFTLFLLVASVLHPVSGFAASECGSFALMRMPDVTITFAKAIEAGQLTIPGIGRDWASSIPAGRDYRATAIPPTWFAPAKPGAGERGARAPCPRGPGGSRPPLAIRAEQSPSRMAAQSAS